MPAQLASFAVARAATLEHGLAVGRLRAERTQVRAVRVIVVAPEAVLAPRAICRYEWYALGLQQGRLAPHHQLRLAVEADALGELLHVWVLPPARLGAWLAAWPGEALLMPVVGHAPINAKGFPARPGALSRLNSERTKRGKAANILMI